MATESETPIAALDTAIGYGGFTGGAIDIEAIKDLSDRAGSAPTWIGLPSEYPGLPETIPVFVDRQSGALRGVKELVEQWRLSPDRKTGTAQVNTLESFIDLTNRHATEHSVIFGDTDWQKPSLTAIIDYHEDAKAGYADNGKHRIHYAFPLSLEWQAWLKMNGKPMTQGEFAEFIEDHIADLAAPDTLEDEDFAEKFSTKVAYPNEMKQLSLGLQINAESRAKSIVKLQSGEGEVTWEEEHRDAKGDKIKVPGIFIINIPPFFLGAPCRIPVRLRYRLVAGSITWIFQLFRPDMYITEQVRRDLERAASDTGLPQYQGKPEMNA